MLPKGYWVLEERNRRSDDTSILIAFGYEHVGGEGSPYITYKEKIRAILQGKGAK